MILNHDAKQLNASSEAQAPEAANQRPLRERLGKMANWVGNASFVALMIIMAILVFSMVQSRLIGGPPSLFGHQIYIVAGGSMSPAFEAGSLSVLRPIAAQEVQVGDIITYHGTSSTHSLTTHRVMEIHQSAGELLFTTRGDANEVNDPVPVSADRLVGKVVYAIPYAGRVMDFGQTRTGLLALVIIPGLFIIGFEVRNLLYLAAEMEKEKQQQRAAASQSDDISD